MRIQELEHATGLDRGTIRFYEKEKLILPQRRENGYRSYSQEDAEDLLKIKLLRQLGMTVEQIRLIKQGSGDFALALENQCHILEGQIATKHRSAQVCREMREADVTYENMDAVFYLTRLTQVPGVLPSGSPPKAFREPVAGSAHPFRRYTARVLDVTILSVLIRFVLFVLLRLRPVPDGLVNTLIVLGFWLLSLPVNAFFLHLWGTTPGKWIMGIRVLDFTGKKLDYADALFREWRVFGEGMGWQLPVYDLIRQYKSFMSYVQTGETDWDEGTEVRFTEWNWKGKAKFAAAAVLIFAMNLFVNADALLPVHRKDDLTVAQFAENYNFFLSQYANYYHPGEKLRSDGSYDEEQNIFRYDYGIYYEANMPWSFETEDGIIRRITGQITGDVEFGGSVSWLTPCKIAAFTAVLSRQGVTFWDVMEFTNGWQEIPAMPAGQLDYEGLRISWNTDMVNCRNENGRFFILDETQPATITVRFEILYN